MTEQIESARAYFGAMDSHRAVIERYRLRSAADIAEDRERQDRAQELRDAAESQAALARLGLVDTPPTHGDILARASAGFDIADRRQEAAERRANDDDRPAAQSALPSKLELRREHAAEAEAAERTPASQGDLRRLQQQVSGLRSKLFGRK